MTTRSVACACRTSRCRPAPTAGKTSRVESIGGPLSMNVRRNHRGPSDRTELLASLVWHGPHRFRSSMAHQNVSQPVVSPGETSNIALRLRYHWCVLVRTAHRSGQHDNPTAVVVVIHEHRSGAVRGGDKTPSHQPIT